MQRALRGRAAYWLVVFLSCSLWGALGEAQLSPPGLGHARTADWTALGVRQDLDAHERRESMSYVGLGRISDRDNTNPLQKQAILVVNQEFYDQFRDNWSYSLAMSFRRQHLYDEEPPYESADPSVQRELRLYARFSHIFKVPRFKLTNTLRPELRTFYARGRGLESENLQFRFRARTQGTFSLDQAKHHRIVASAEALASVSKERSGNWTDFSYRESRFCLYYSLSPQRLPVVFDIGYMNNLLGNSRQVADVHYLAIDVIWENAFGTPVEARPE